MNHLRELEEYGQAIWLDYIRRNLITSGELKRLVEEDGLSGITSNPTIFEKAISGSSDYDDAIREFLGRDPEIGPSALFESLSIQDIQMAADVLRPVFDRTNGADGFVSLELLPNLAYDTEGSIAEAHRLWKAVDRPNIMLKVPDTLQGLGAIEELTASSINVNITLMFALDDYEPVADAYLRGLERCQDPRRVASVASFFLSRIDTQVDRALEAIGTQEALALRGKIAIACAKIVYRLFREKFSGERWERLSRRGARAQRVLWASTSTKNPAYSDVYYVENLIGSDTINTLPPATLNAFKDHGRAQLTITRNVEEAEAALKMLNRLGVDLKAVTDKLHEEGIRAFEESYDKLMSTLKAKKQKMLGGQVDLRTFNLGRYQARLESRLRNWRETDTMRRIWAKDYTLWSKEHVPEVTDRLGWLFLPENMHDEAERFASFSAKIKSDGIKHVVLLGMGGSSLAPEVFERVFGSAPGFPSLTVLDSIHPAAVKAVEDRVALKDTVFVVSSKSGTTIETLSLLKYFWDRMGKADEQNRGAHFIAITDPETPLMKLAEEHGFRKIFQAPPDVGGRYSALTAFGLLPAALIGADTHELLDRAWTTAENNAFFVSPHRATGLVLGAALSELTLMGRDKVTFFASAPINSFPVWLEQLIAESTGKEGKGIIPVVDEPLLEAADYGDDRLFVYLSTGEEDSGMEDLVKTLTSLNHPLIRINLTEPMDLGQEIFAWEMAIAAAGIVLGINPFNQPNVQMAKDLAHKMMQENKKSEISAEAMSVEDTALPQAFEAWLKHARDRDYIAIQAYLQPTAETTQTLQRIRVKLAKRLRLATTLGYGPRFLHSTGQLHKGGPNTGLFLQLIDEPEEDLEVPETDYSFGGLTRAEALGDYQALKQLGRRVLRVNLGKDVEGGLAKLLELAAQ